ncbi:putative WD repeat-containing protein [Podosphaera aphanis]|nr:putative WD repeat-containing protein [Podosphaera aphanis]
MKRWLSIYTKVTKSEPLLYLLTSALKIQRCQKTLILRKASAPADVFEPLVLTLTSPPVVENGLTNDLTTPNWSAKESLNKDIHLKKALHSPALISPGIDPLSHQILWRMQTGKASKLRSPGIDSPVQQTGPPPDGSTDIYPTTNRTESLPQKEKKKGVSFLSRLNIKGGKKKESYKDVDEFETDDPRIEGTNAHVFSSSISASGFVPQHKEPPNYIKVRPRYKKQREFDHMFLAQELRTDDRLGEEILTEPKVTIWCMEFSLDGRFLAAAGRDQIVRIWAVLSTPEERRTHEQEEDVFSGTSGGKRLSAPVFKSKPIREYQSHTGDIIDVYWSKNNFLLSSSMDKSVKLWHPSRKECLCTFNHLDFVTSIAFHPTDDRFFLAGSLDSVLRLWSIPEKKVIYSCEFPEIITAVAFTPNGKSAIAGGISGICQFYSIDHSHGLKVCSQIHVRSSRGKNSKGSKITGIRTTGTLPDFPGGGEVNILVTSNDSRIRLYNFKEERLEMKFQGHENTCSQIKASFSDDGRYVICGSENRKAYIWNICPKDAEAKEKPPMEMFNAHSSIVTAAIMAPAATRRLLSGSGDPIYDVCNPPPITLLSLEEFNLDSEKQISDTAGPRNFDEYPSYLARTSHDDGPIIVTSDYTGSIKCFRLDCAYEKRHQWDTSSTFSRKRSSLRVNSINTRNSTGSRHNSLSRSQSSFNISATTAVSIEQNPPWRNEVKDEPNYPPQNLPSRNEIKATPNERMSQDLNRDSFQSSVTSQSHNRQEDSVESSPRAVFSNSKNPSASASPPASKTLEVLDETTRRNDSTSKLNYFWNINSWRTTLGYSSSSRGPEGFDSGGRSLGERSDHFGGHLSRELSGVEEEGQECTPGSEEELLRCPMCNGKDFKRRKVSGRGLVMVCVGCGVIMG